MDREDLIGAVAAVLASHDSTADYSSYCICKQKLWGAADSVTMRRHRAEKIIDRLETLAVLKKVPPVPEDGGELQELIVDAPEVIVT